MFHFTICCRVLIQVLFIFCCASVGAAASGPAVWINELHYDNAGSDVMEFIEVAGSAGLDLSDYSLVLYNGNGGGVYNTVPLSGFIPDEGSGGGAVSFPISGIQNGSPDGLALVELSTNTVVLFLSYEGDFMATDGPANGMTSTDIGVAETSSTPVGQSLQLQGTGCTYAEFSWTGPAANSPGTLNAGQTYSAPGPGNAPPSAGPPRVDVIIPTSGGAACPAVAAVLAPDGSPLMAGDILAVDDFITVAGLGVPVPTSSEVSDDTDPPSALAVNVVAVSVTPGQCTTSVAITYTVEDTQGAMSAERTDTFVLVDDTAPVLNSSLVTASFALDAGVCTDDIQTFIENNLPLGLPMAPGAVLLQNVPITGGVTTLTFPTTGFFVENCSDEQTGVTITASGLTFSSNSCESITASYQLAFADECGNESTAQFELIFNVSAGGVVLPPNQQLAIATSAGADCLDPLAGLAVGDMFAPGASITVAGQMVMLPAASMVSGCLGASPIFGITTLQSTAGTNPCETNILVEAEFDSDCASSSNTTYSINITLTDDTPPIVTAPANVSISCEQNASDLSLTGMATATDNCAPGGPSPLLAQGPVFINEFHYDNPGVDAGEFVEIAGPAGTDLAGYSIELINGNNALPYDTQPLNGTIPDEGAGFGALSFAIAGIQNGAPDGIALCGPNGVLEFLSYEGAFVAAGGCAQGLMSTDVGVEESTSSNYAIGASLQRTGTGSNGGDFTFIGPAPESPGLLNAGQSFVTGGGGGGNTGGPVATSFTDNIIPGACASSFTIQRTFTATDACGNVGSALQIITVTDDSPPVFDQQVGALDATVTTTQLDAAGLGDCAITLDLAALQLQATFALLFGQTNFLNLFTFPTATDACGAANLQVQAVTSGSVTGMAPCAAEVVFTFVASDACGNADTYAVTLTIVDDQAPVLEPGFVSTFTIECDMPFDTSVTGTPIFIDNCGSSRPAAPSVWINEFHYDNAGTDVNEFIEVAGTAGLDLAGYTLLAYNGSNGSVYNTIQLTGIIPDEGNGGGAVSVSLPTNGLQNGSPDGIALVDAAGMVIEFLSYEGDFIATNGAAQGQTSTDIGVSETGSSLASESLQRTGAGSMGSDFTFIGPAPASPGMLNVGQTYVSGQTVAVSFSESAIPNPSCSNGQVITRTFIANDGCGNTTSAVQTINVVDTQAPQYTLFQADTTIECSTLSGPLNMLTVAAIADALPFPLVTDNCTTNLNPTFVDAFDNTATCPTVGTFTRSFAPVDDGCGNILAARTLTITIIDTLAPVLDGLPAAGDIDCSIGLPLLGQVVVEDCDAGVVLTEVDETDTSNSLGLGLPGQNGVVSVTTRNITATDQCGNVSTEELVFRVLDLEAPVLLSCTDDIGPLVARPDDRVAVDFVMPEFSDNCSFTVQASAQSGDDFGVGLNTVTVTALDEGGNSAVCSFTVEVVRALNISCTTTNISVADASTLTRADINFPYATTTCADCPAPGEPLAGLEYLGYFRGHRYYVSAPGVMRSWPEANDYALSIGGRLVQIDGPEENLFLQRELPYAQALIGLWAPNGQGDWVWTTDDNATQYRNWAGATPSGMGAEIYAALDAASGQHVAVDYAHRPYLIEFDCINFEVIQTSSDSLYGVGPQCIVYAAEDRCGNRDTCHYLFTVTTFDVNYCYPDLTSFDFIAEEEYYITGVQLGAFAKTFGATASAIATRDTIKLEEDDPTPLVLSAETTGMAGANFPAYWRIWVDANQDGDFYESGELIFEGFGSAVATGDVVLPSSLATVSPTRLRVAVSRYAFPEPCGPDPFGDFKDFTLITTMPSQPRFALSGTISRGNQPSLTTHTLEDAEIDSYLLLRGVNPHDLSKYHDWIAVYGDGSLYDYNFLDADPLLAAYYQAVALDADGYIIRRSNVVHVELPSRKGNVLIAHPNPASDYVDLTTGGVPPRTGGQVELYDAIGRKVLERHWPVDEPRLRVMLPRLATGTYVLRATLGDEQALVKRVVVEQGGNKVSLQR